MTVANDRRLVTPPEHSDDATPERFEDDERYNEIYLNVRQVEHGHLSSHGFMSLLPSLLAAPTGSGFDDEIRRASREAMDRVRGYEAGQERSEEFNAGVDTLIAELDAMGELPRGF